MPDTWKENRPGRSHRHASRAAEIALTEGVAREHNHFKIELAKRTIVRAFAAARDANTIERRVS
jgi:CO/xanthine dehydrogenase FAD-binding subunit